MGDDAERAQRADIELAQIVTSHVLNDAAASLDFLSLIVNHADADNVVAERA